MPIRESLEPPPGPIDATVTLEEIETGKTVVMSDSMFRYLPVNLENINLYRHNFSTTMPIVPGRHYRLTATRSDGAAAWGTVLIPASETATLDLSNSFLIPSLQNDPRMRLTAGAIRGIRHIGMVLGREAVPDRCNLPYPIHQQFLPITRRAAFEGDSHAVQLSWGENRPWYVPAPPACHLGPKRVLVIASGDKWPYEASTPLRELAHLGAIDNIEGLGVGFLAGVQTHVFPFAGCIPLERVPCKITFSPRSGTLVGMVTNACTGGPLQDLRVRLLGLAANGIRYDTTDVAGVFQFEGMEPGAAHSIALSQLVATGDFDPVEVENLSVAEATVDTVSIEMIHRRNCAS
jgi:hypothetical protein